MVFCDLRGFTDFSGRVEPEEIMQVIGEYYAAVGTSITHYQATLTHFSGDGLMVLLNAPLRCPDDPVLRAIRMAKDIQAAVQALTPAGAPAAMQSGSASAWPVVSRPWVVSATRNVTITPPSAPS